MKIEDGFDSRRRRFKAKWECKCKNVEFKTADPSDKKLYDFVQNRKSEKLGYTSFQNYVKKKIEEDLKKV